MTDDAFANRPSEAGAAAGGPAEDGIDDATLTEAQRNEIRRRRAMASAVDFGKPKNLGLPE